MISEPLISIVLPVYNREGIVDRTLQSIAAQTFRPFHVVLVDNNSTDGTLYALQRWAQKVNDGQLTVEVVRCATPGAAAARNAGLARVTSPWVMHFDSDDTMSPRHLERVARAIMQNPRADVIGWPVRVHLLGGDTKTLPFNMRNLLYDCVLHGSFSSLRYACRTDLVRDCGAWDENLRTWDDIELGTRLIIRYPDINVTRLKGKPSVDVYQSEVSISGENYHSRAQESELALETMSRSIHPYEQHIVNLKRVILAANYRREGHRRDAKALKRHALNLTPSIWHRTLLRIAYAYRRVGGRGISRILYPFW